jgi:hypothetical protein
MTAISMKLFRRRGFPLAAVVTSFPLFLLASSYHNLHRYLLSNDILFDQNMPVKEVPMQPCAALGNVNDTIHTESMAALPLLPWEEEVIHGLKHGQFACAGRPEGMPIECCPGYIMHSGIRDFGKVCSHTDYERIRNLASKFMDQWPTTDDDCDICRILNILRKRKKRLTVVGDSVSLQSFEGLLCEFRRRNYLVERTRKDRPELPNTGSGDKLQIRSNHTVTIKSPSWPENHVVHIQLIFIYSVPFMLPEEAEEIYQAGGIMWFNFGLHGGHTHSLATFQRNMEDFFSAMRKNGTSSLLLFRETTAQHFDTPTGMYGMYDIDHRSMKCTPLEWTHEVGSRDRAVVDAARAAGYDVASPSEAASDKLVILPFHNFTAQLYDSHPHDAGEFNNSTNQQDCTHYCLSPFLWVPLWRTLRIAMDAAYRADL